MFAILIVFFSKAVWKSCYPNLHEPSQSGPVRGQIDLGELVGLGFKLKEGLTFKQKDLHPLFLLQHFILFSCKISFYFYHNLDPGSWQWPRPHQNFERACTQSLGLPFLPLPPKICTISIVSLAEVAKFSCMTIGGYLAEYSLCISGNFISNILRQGMMKSMRDPFSCLHSGHNYFISQMT